MASLKLYKPFLHSISIERSLLILLAPTPQNGHTQTIRQQFADKLSECVSFCGAGA